MRGLSTALVLIVAGCDLPERGDFLVGRACIDGAGECDPGQACLPHRFEGAQADDFRCRDAASLEATDGVEAPTAYCDPARGWWCPAPATCRAGRIRADGGLRRTECRAPGAPFGPPVDAGAGP